MDLITYGKILKPHGLKGEVKVLPYSGQSENFSQIQHLYINSNKDEFGQHEVLAKKFHKNLIIVRIQDIDSIEDAELLRGKEVHVDKEELPSKQEDEYYWFELVNLNVYSRNGSFIGKVDSIIDNTAQPVLIIKNSSSEYMVPLIDIFVKEIDLNYSKIVIKSIDDLI